MTSLGIQVAPALCCPHGIGLDFPAWRRSVTDSLQVHEQILEWNGERTPDRSAKASANRRYGELRKENDVTTLLALFFRHMPYAVFSSLFYFAHLLYWKTVMITTISKCTKGTAKSISRMRRYALTFRAFAPQHCISIDI